MSRVCITGSASVSMTETVPALRCVLTFIVGPPVQPLILSSVIRWEHLAACVNACLAFTMTPIWINRLKMASALGVTRLL